MAEININVSTILAKAEKANEAATHAPLSLIHI